MSLNERASMTFDRKITVDNGPLACLVLACEVHSWFLSLIHIQSLFLFLHLSNNNMMEALKMWKNLYTYEISHNHFSRHSPYMWMNEWIKKKAFWMEMKRRGRWWWCHKSAKRGSQKLSLMAMGNGCWKRVHRAEEEEKNEIIKKYICVYDS